MHTIFMRNENVKIFSQLNLLILRRKKTTPCPTFSVFLFYLFFVTHLRRLEILFTLFMSFVFIFFFLLFQLNVMIYVLPQPVSIIYSVGLYTGEVGEWAELAFPEASVALEASVGL